MGESNHQLLIHGRIFTSTPFKSESTRLLCEVDTQEKFVRRRIENPQASRIECIKALSDDKSGSNLLKYFHHSFIKETSILYMTVEYSKGGSLGDLLTMRKENSKLPSSSSLPAPKMKQALDEEEVVMYMAQVLDGLCFLHNKKIYHGDIRPHSVFLFDNRVVKLGDISYTAPEVLTGGQMTVKTDIWNLGCLCYELLFKKCPNSMEWAKKAGQTRKVNSLRGFLKKTLTLNKNRISSKELRKHNWFESWRAKVWDKYQELMLHDSSVGSEYFNSVWALFKGVKWPKVTNKSSTTNKRKSSAGCTTSDETKKMKSERDGSWCDLM